jgi:hypothetical protein
MAPEQYEGRSVFASDLYSLGVTMYQMLTGVLPYDMPAPSDMEKLRTGELVSSPRLRNPSIPKVIDDIVMRALAADVSARYQSGEALLEDLLQARRDLVRRPAPDPPVAAPAAAAVAAPAGAPVRRPAARIRTREIAASRFCSNCRKPLPARAVRCPFCGESQ